MALYKYKARNENGKDISGSRQAFNEDDLYARLKEEGLLAYSIQEQKAAKRTTPLKLGQLADFSRQVGNLLASGVSLVKTLNIIGQEPNLKPKEKAVYSDVLQLIREGHSLSDAMEEQGRVFPPMMIHMYRSAETGGNLDRTALRLAEHYNKEDQVNKKINNATTYPKILSVIIVLVVVIILEFVIPQFKTLFDKMEEMPLSTTMLLWIAEVVQSHWLIILLFLIAFIAALFLVLQIPAVRLKVDFIKVRMPLLGRLFKIIYTARFSRSLVSLYSSGIPIIVALQISCKTINNSYIESQFDDLIFSLKAGKNLSEGLKKVDGFSQKLVSVIQVGEEAGTLDIMLESMANNMEYEAEMAIQKMVSYLEPAMIVIMGIIVGFVMVAVITPIYSSLQTIGS